jgi:tetratricopeptide (TPR) repeat protein
MADPADFWARDDQAETWSKAMALFQKGYDLQTQGLWADAIAHYRASIRLHPSAEAHTYLGWVYSFLRLYDEAIEECQRAILVDPEFGNPYNDIGAYLIELGRLEEAIPWFERAVLAPRYEARCYPYYNLGRAFEKQGKWLRAIECYRLALAEMPRYDLARTALIALQARLN